MTVGFITLDVDDQIFLWRERFRVLTRYTADQNAYLKIRYRNGKILHQPGPCLVYMNPQEHASIQVERGINLDANEVLVVYQRDEATKEVRRYLEHGPTLFIPCANEWLHSFCWHGTDPQNKTRMIPDADKFTKLRIIPDQLYYNVPEVRTADDAQIRIKLMMFYELIDIEKMLSETVDPKADFINCMTADVVAYTASLTYMEFVERSGELNDLKRYPQLLERCEMIGFNVTNIVFRGYHASPKLQELHDTAIRRRTELTLSREKEEQKQLMTDMKLKSDMECISLEQSLEIGKLQHRLKMQKAEKEHQLKMEEAAWTEEFRQLKQNEEGKLTAKKQVQDQEVKYYQNLSHMEVNVNEVLLSANPKPAKVVHIVGAEHAANLHLHQ